MALIGTLISFSPGTKIVSADVNSNFSAIRNAFNGSAVLTDTITTITVTHTFSTGFVISGGQVGGSVAFASGITISSSGLTVTAGGISVVAGNVGIGSAVQTQNALRIAGSIITGSVSQFGISCDITGSSGATSEIGGAVFRAQTAAATYSVSSLYGLHVVDCVQGAGSTITTQYGLKIDDQTKGTNKIALKTGLGLVQLGDNVTCAAALNVAGALVVTGNATLNAALNVIGAITCSSLTVSSSFSAASFSASGTMTASSMTATATIVAAAFFATAGNSAASPGLAIGTAGNGIANTASNLALVIASVQQFTVQTTFCQANAEFVCGTSLATSATNGFIYIPTVSASSSATPGGHAGTVPLYYNTGDNHLYAYNGGWKSVALA